MTSDVMPASAISSTWRGGTSQPPANNARKASIKDGNGSAACVASASMTRMPPAANGLEAEGRRHADDPVARRRGFEVARVRFVDDHRADVVAREDVVDADEARDV